MTGLSRIWTQLLTRRYPSPMPTEERPPIERKDASRRKATITTLIGGTAGTLIVTVQAAVLIPLYINHIGPRLYGAWLASGDFLVWMQAFDLGLPNLMIQRIAMAYGKGGDCLRRRSKVWHWDCRARWGLQPLSPPQALASPFLCLAFLVWPVSRRICFGTLLPAGVGRRCCQPFQ